MTEYRFDHIDEFPGGRVILRFENRGSIDHTFSIVQIAEGTRAAEDERPRALPTVARGFRRSPGGAMTLAVDLGPGRYRMSCFIEDPDGVNHADKGMTSEFVVLR